MKSFLIRSFFLIMLTVTQLAVFAQENLKQVNGDIKSWVSQNWQWIAGGVLVLLLIVVASGRRRSNRKTTTIVKDDFGNVKSIVSTEIKE